MQNRRFRRNALKIIVIGDAGVGKTSLTQRYLTGKFTSQYRATIGADFLSRNLTLNNKEYSLQVWDTAGQERFRAIGSAFYRGSDCCMIAYDITDPQSFENIDEWKKTFLEDGRVDDPNFPFVIVGNKGDLEEARKVSRSQAELWCRDNGGFPWFEVSAKDGSGIEEAFDVVIQKAAEQYLKSVRGGEAGGGNDAPKAVDLNEVKGKADKKKQEDCAC